MTPYQQELLENLRRTAEKGRALAVRNRDVAMPAGAFVDLFQHLLDELERLKGPEPEHGSMLIFD